MSDWTAIKNKIINECLDQPLLTSLFVTDFAILLFHRPPLLYSLAMMLFLVVIAMYFGQKLALFNVKTAFQFLKSFNFSKSTEKAMAGAVGDVKGAVSDVKAAVADAVDDIVDDMSTKPTPKAKAKPKAKI